MRSTAQIGKISLGIKSYFTIMQILKQVQFVFIIFRGEILNGFWF